MSPDFLNVIYQGTKDSKVAITIKSNSNGGKAVAIGFDVGAYVGASIGGKTDGIPRTYVAKVTNFARPQSRLGK